MTGSTIDACPQECCVPEPVWRDLLERLRNMKKCKGLQPVRQFMMVGRQKGPPTKAEEAAGRERVANLRGAVDDDFQKQCEAEMRRTAALVTGSTPPISSHDLLQS